MSAEQEPCLGCTHTLSVPIDGGSVPVVVWFQRRESEDKMNSFLFCTTMPATLLFHRTRVLDHQALSDAIDTVVATRSPEGDISGPFTYLEEECWSDADEIDIRLHPTDGTFTVK
jgi:hypothetical protein